ncbi:MAG: SUMF1/EgtB/PvdO family nonheme iron enzyme, partial [Panacagrimonas sp.]
PSGASVRVGKEFRGQTPIELKLAPGQSQLVQISAPGHQPAERKVEVAAEGREDLAVELEPILGTVMLDVQPAEAAVKIDGRALAAGTSRIELTAVAHKIEASMAGRAPWSGSVTPRPGFEQRVEIRLRSESEARAARTPARVVSKAGPALILVQPGAFVMGTPRGEQGRQSNEAVRPVRLTRAFYLSATEVTNAQFRRFASGHSSGIVKRETLDNDRQPAARVSWDDAARYCNWLSQQDGLEPAYREDGGAMRRVEPPTTGYRLPSEAEWEWAARFAGGAISNGRRYPWGSGFPPPARAGNFADVLAEGLAPAVLPDYEDGYPAAAPVGSFAPGPLGLLDLGGNVAEWVHDVYDGTLPIDPPEAADPFGPASGSEHVIRGSSWMHGRLVELRVAYRDVGHEARADVGFRVARYAE